MLLGVFLHGRFVSSDLIYLFSLLFISIWSYRFFYYNPILLISLLKLFPALAIESRVPVTYLHHCFLLAGLLVCLELFHFFAGTVMLQAHPVYLLFQPLNQPALQGTFISFIEEKC